MFDAPPKPLHEDVVIGSATTAHADGNGLTFEYARKVIAGELAALFAVEHLRWTSWKNEWYGLWGAGQD